MFALDGQRVILYALGGQRVIRVCVCLDRQRVNVLVNSHWKWLLMRPVTF